MPSFVEPPDMFSSPQTKRAFLRQAQMWPQDDPAVKMAIELVKRELKDAKEPLEVPEENPAPPPQKSADHSS